MPKATSGPAKGIELNNLICCPTCDLIYEERHLPPDERARCHRCHTVLISATRNTIDRMIASSFGIAILMIAAVTMPFLRLSASGVNNSASIIDAIDVFVGGAMTPLALIVAGQIIVLPVLRAVLLCYVLVPMRLSRPLLPYAARAFHQAEKLKPWSMAEIFIIGVAVALVKVAGLAHVEIGPAFWAFCGMVLMVVMSDSILSKWTIWEMLEKYQAD
ncbi:paraquat-inducible protein A [Paracoccaceae bacterium GXU_MW_L88]